MRTELAYVVWPVATVLVYVVTRHFYRRAPSWWNSPLLLTPVILLAIAGALHTRYSEYMQGSQWLLAMIGPVTVAFALPVYEQRALIRRHWPALLAGVIAGSIIAAFSSWLLASWLNLPSDLQRSLLPRSIATPFALPVSSRVGGVPELTAVFVVLTGLLGAVVGQVMRKWLPLRSSLARGALLGMGAHGVGVAKAREYAAEEGSIAGLVMILAGLVNVSITPIAVMLLL